MKPREARRKVLIDARLRQERGWSDARILNLSSRGMMVRASSAPARGSYVEISRGTYRIVARVVWVKGDRFGARSQDSIAVEAMAKGEELPKPANFNKDRRLQRRELDPKEQHERSRTWSRRLELAVVVALGFAAAVLAFDAVRETLSRPLNRIEALFGAAG